MENPLSDSDAGTTEDEDVSEVASSSSGPPHDPPPPRGSAVPAKPESKIVDELGTQPVEPEEPVIPPVAKDDPALEARKKLEMELKQVPTPSKVVAAAAQVGWAKTIYIYKYQNKGALNTIYIYNNNNKHNKNNKKI